MNSYGFFFLKRIKIIDFFNKVVTTTTDSAVDYSTFLPYRMCRLIQDL